MKPSFPAPVSRKGDRIWYQAQHYPSFLLSLGAIDRSRRPKPRDTTTFLLRSRFSAILLVNVSSQCYSSGDQAIQMNVLSHGRYDLAHEGQGIGTGISTAFQTPNTAPHPSSPFYRAGQGGVQHGFTKRDEPARGTDVAVIHPGQKRQDRAGQGRQSDGNTNAANDAGNVAGIMKGRDVHTGDKAIVLAGFAGLKVGIICG